MTWPARRKAHDTRTPVTPVTPPQTKTGALGAARPNAPHTLEGAHSYNFKHILGNFKVKSESGRV